MAGVSGTSAAEPEPADPDPAWGAGTAAAVTGAEFGGGGGSYREPELQAKRASTSARIVLIMDPAFIMRGVRA